MGSTKGKGLPVRICALLLSLVMLLSILPGVALAKENEFSISISTIFNSTSGEPLSSVSPQLRLFSGENEIQENTRVIDGVFVKYAFDIQEGTYRYEVYTEVDGADYRLGCGDLTLSQENSDITLMCVNVDSVIHPLQRNQFTINITHQDGRVFESSKGGFYFYVPAYRGDSYYWLELIPNDIENYVEQKAHFYVYPNSNNITFFQLNLSDMHQYSLVERKNFIIKAPKGVEVYYVDQIRFYMARDFFPLEKDETSSEADTSFDYYMADHLGTLMLRQEGKVTRYCELSGSDARQIDVGTWNEDGTILTLRELTNDNKQINRGNFEANLMTNTDYSRTLELSSGSYFDFVPLRAWQAVKSTTGNQHFDPDFHYTVLGDSVTVERTEDDLTWQFGRIQAQQPGVSLVLFSYDAMEYTNTVYSDGHGFHCYSALWPENTGIQIVEVDSKETGIKDNINLSSLDTLYYLAMTTDELVNATIGDSYYSYTFLPTSDKGEEISVRVHEPYMIQNGQLNFTEENWLADGHWTNYSANEDGSFTIQLKEGRNIVEISTASGAVYRVLNAHAMQLTLSNKTRPNQAFAIGDTAVITLNGLQMAIYKLAAIFNPAGVAEFELNGSLVHFGGKDGYNLNNGAEFELYLDEAGTVSFEKGGIAASTYTLVGSVNNALQQLCRNSRNASEFSGQNSPTVNYKNSILPGFSFEVADNSDIEEINKRKAGELLSLKIRNSEMQDLFQTRLFTDLDSLPLFITAVSKDANAKMYWRFIQIGEDEPIEWKELPNNEQTNLLNVDELFYINGSPGFLQILVNPERGYPLTYSVNFTDGNLKTSIGAVKISSTIGHGTMGTFDGELHSTPVNYKCGEETITDLGYGFIGGISHFTSSVPYEVDQIKIDLIAINSYDTIIAEELYTQSAKKYARTIKVYRLDGTEKNELEYGAAIDLVVGDNTFVIEELAQVGKNYNYTRSAEYTYNITITRRAAPKTVSFDIPNGASILLEQNGKIIKANEDGTYTLDDGTYTYYVSKPGCLTKIADFPVEGTEPTMTVTVTDLDPVPEQSGSVTVRIAGQDAVIVPEETVEISDDPEDLAKLRYVRYNHGGYTVLHALIDACEPVPFTCRNGSFVPEIAIDETGVGPKAGWVCRVNGAVCADPANTLVNGGDKIDFYYDSDYADMLYARFTEEAASVTEGSDAELTLTVGGDTNAPISGAEIYLGETLVGVTDSAGKITVPAELLPEKRSYFITAESKNNDGQNILTCAAAIVTVEKDENKEPANPGYTTVSFRLIGDTKHGDETQYHAYSTWIGTTAYAFDSEKVSVGDVFQRALTEAGLTFVGLNKNYIESIVGPDGDILEEFSNGVNSGWMFMVNGVHSGQGLNNIYVTDGDEIVWHYVDDYVQETMDNFEGTSGNTATWSTWLDAADGPSINAGVIVAIDGAEIARENNAFTATLPVGSEYPTAAQIRVTPEDKAATVSALTGPETDEEGETWAFSVTAESGKTVNYTLKVVATVVPVTGVTLSETQASVAVGKTLTLTAAVEPENATDPTVTWLSSDESIATVADGVVTGVKAGTATITAQAGDMTASCVVTVTAPAPAAPENVEAAAAAGKITVSFDAVEGAAKYLIQRRSYDGSAWSSYATLKTLTGTSYVDAAVTAGSRYQYRVRAYVDGAWGKFGTAAAVTVPAPAPAAPVISAAAEDGKVTVQWAAVDNATKYAVYRRAYVSGAWESAWTQFTATEAGYADGSVTASTKYQYRVRAYGPGGWSGFSNALTVTTPAAAPTVPAAPTGVTAATTNGSKVVTLSWDAVEGADSFVIYRRAYNNETASWGGWEQFTSSTNGYVDEGADYGTIYKYRIKARNAVGLSKTFSEDATAKTPPATPTISDVKVENGKVTVSWGAVSGATRYQVFRRVKEGNRWGAMTRLTTTTETSYVDTTAEAGTVYQYLVKSYNGGYSGYSAGKQITAK